MFALTVRFDLSDEAAAAAFDALAAQTAADVRALEPDTLTCAVHSVEGEPLARVFYEAYRDRAAFEVHGSQPHTQQFFAHSADLVVRTRLEFRHPHEPAIQTRPASGSPRTATPKS
ncbi:putative quinol monooxygenase [Streptacidiphilus rugosus]|uniref:putative quinol monooxygenase n=1 Tax=Streptacidiphilus rugosus TaxID=405783 RepID=UPI0007C86A0B|nr:antibiotic biosynthesis monooxygenase [Streptacidiphilus rugosus]